MSYNIEIVGLLSYNVRLHLIVLEIEIWHRHIFVLYIQLYQRKNDHLLAPLTICRRLVLD